MRLLEKDNNNDFHLVKRTNKLMCDKTGTEDLVLMRRNIKVKERKVENDKTLSLYSNRPTANATVIKDVSSCFHS